MKKILCLIICLMMLSACGEKENKSNDTPKEEVKASPITLTDTEKLHFDYLFYVLPHHLDEVNYNDFDNQEKLVMALELLKAESTSNITHIINDYKTTKASLTAILAKYFGEDESLVMENIICPYCDQKEVYYIYNSATEEYEYNNHGHGIDEVGTHYKIVESTTLDNKVYITIVLGFTEVDYTYTGENNYKLYKTYNDAARSENMLYDGSAHCVFDDIWLDCDFAKMVDDAKDLLNKYTFTFDYTNKNLVFESMKIN